MSIGFVGSALELPVCSQLSDWNSVNVALEVTIINNE